MITSTDGLKPGDPYRHTDGSLWVVTWIRSEPSIGLRCVYKTGGNPDDLNEVEACVGTPNLKPFARLLEEDIPF